MLQEDQEKEPAGNPERLFRRLRKNTEMKTGIKDTAVLRDNMGTFFFKEIFVIQAGPFVETSV